MNNPFAPKPPIQGRIEEDDAGVSLKKLQDLMAKTKDPFEGAWQGIGGLIGSVLKPSAPKLSPEDQVYGKESRLENFSPESQARIQRNAGIIPSDEKCKQELKDASEYPSLMSILTETKDGTPTDQEHQKMDDAFAKIVGAGKEKNSSGYTIPNGSPGGLAYSLATGEENPHAKEATSAAIDWIKTNGQPKIASIVQALKPQYLVNREAADAKAAAQDASMANSRRLIDALQYQREKGTIDDLRSRIQKQGIQPSQEPVAYPSNPNEKDQIAPGLYGREKPKMELVPGRVDARPMIQTSSENEKTNISPISANNAVGDFLRSSVAQEKALPEGTKVFHDNGTVPLDEGHGMMLQETAEGKPYYAQQPKETTISNQPSLAGDAGDDEKRQQNKAKQSSAAPMRKAVPKKMTDDEMMKAADAYLSQMTTDHNNRMSQGSAVNPLLNNLGMVQTSSEDEKDDVSDATENTGTPGYDGTKANTAPVDDDPVQSKIISLMRNQSPGQAQGSLDPMAQQNLDARETAKSQAQQAALKANQPTQQADPSYQQSLGNTITGPQTNQQTTQQFDQSSTPVNDGLVFDNSVQYRPMNDGGQMAEVSGSSPQPNVANWFKTPIPSYVAPPASTPISGMGTGSSDPYNNVPQLMSDEDNKDLISQLLPDKPAGGGDDSGGSSMSSMMPMLMMMMSDENCKTEIKRGGEKGNSLTEFLDTLTPYEFKYKRPTADGSNGQTFGQKAGIMAQDLEKSELGKQAVIETKQGKMVNFGSLIPVTIAGLVNERNRNGMQDERLRRIEELMMEKHK